MKMNSAFIILSFCLISCAPRDMFKNQGLHNGCALDAVAMQAAVKAQAAMESKNLWAKILIVEFSEGNKPRGHVYCIFEDTEGTIWAYDWSGSKRLRWNTKEPLYIANQLRGNVSRAYFSDSQRND